MTEGKLTRLFHRRPEPVKEVTPPKVLSPEVLAEREKADAWYQEWERRMSLNWEERVAEAYALLDKGDLLQAHAILTCAMRPDSPLLHVMADLLALYLQHEDTLKSRRDQA